MAWTEITRAKHDRSGLRYASDCTDEEWAVVAPFLVLLQRSLARAAGLHKRLSRVSSRGDLEQTCDEATLSPDVVSTDISNLPLSDHRHRLKTRQCSSGRPEPAKPQPRTSQSLNTPVILLENVVEVFNLAQP